jgi:hypothetical protein
MEDIVQEDSGIGDHYEQAQDAWLVKMWPGDGVEVVVAEEGEAAAVVVRYS